MKTLTLSLVASSIVIVCGIGGCRTSTADNFSVSEETPVIIREVTRVIDKSLIFVSGTLEADKIVPLSFLVPGKVTRVYVDEGEHIKKGKF